MIDAEPKLPATSYVVLGLVSIRPGAGHDLAAFAERSIGNFFPIARSQVYAELDRLCRLGWLSVTEVPQQRFPTKRIYEVTETGREKLKWWLEEQRVEPERHRNLFLVRVFFGDRVSRERLDALLDEYEARSRAYRDGLAATVQRLAGRPQSVFPRATALFGLHHAQATLDWVADVRSILGEAPCGAAER